MFRYFKTVVVILKFITSLVVLRNYGENIVMPMYNLLEYSKNYSKTFGSLWNYYRVELTDEKNYNNGLNKNVINSKLFKYKTSITGSTYNVAATAEGYNVNKECTKNVETAVSFKQFLENTRYTINQL